MPKLTVFSSPTIKLSFSEMENSTDETLSNETLEVPKITEQEPLNDQILANPHIAQDINNDGDHRSEVPEIYEQEPLNDQILANLHIAPVINNDGDHRSDQIITGIDPFDVLICEEDPAKFMRVTASQINDACKQTEIDDGVLVSEETLDEVLGREAAAEAEKNVTEVLAELDLSGGREGRQEPHRNQIRNTADVLTELDEERIQILLRRISTEPSPSHFRQNPQFRSDVVDFILQTTNWLRLSLETAYLAVSYMDTFLLDALEWSGLHEILAISCLILAAKVAGHPYRAPLLKILEPRRMNESVKEEWQERMKSMELDILKRLGWRMHKPTPFTFIGYLSLKLDSGNHEGLEYNAAMMILGLLAEINSLDLHASAVAAAAVLVAYFPAAVSFAELSSHARMAVTPVHNAQLLHELNDTKKRD